MNLRSLRDAALDSLRDAALDALALVLPVECAGCGAPDRAVCGVCRRALAPHPSVRQLTDGTPVCAGLEYEGVARAVILAYKEQGRTELCAPLAIALAASVRAAGQSFDLRGAEVVCVPGSRAARRRRGFDPVSALVTRAGLERARVFSPARPHHSQKSLSLVERGVNLQGAFAVCAVVTGRRFLLVDDVVTTGATLEAAAHCLRVAGAEVVGAAVVASTPRRRISSNEFHGERSSTFS
jgi:ComF family protein